MNDLTLTEIAPSGVFMGQNPLTPDGTYRVNCSNQLLSAQEAAILCSPDQIAADRVSPGSASADLDIGRRNIEGGGRGSRYQHLNRSSNPMSRVILPTSGLHRLGREMGLPSTLESSTGWRR